MKYIIFLFHLCLITACVSVQFEGGTSKSKKASNIQYNKPSSELFDETDMKNSDASWISKKTGSSISYFSSCSQNEPPLRNIRANALQGIESVDIKSEESISINNREGLLSLVEGKLEGVPIAMELIIFKKNLCSFQLSFVALKKNFDKEKNIFKNFSNSFKVP